MGLIEVVSSKQIEIDLKYMREVAKIASENSPDPSTQTGALIILDNSIFDIGNYNVLGRGYNSFPSGVIHTSERWNNKEKKYPRVLHAEEAAVCDAASRGRPIAGKDMVKRATLYTMWPACGGCGKVIIGAHIKRVIYYEGVKEWDTKQGWGDSQKIAQEMFDEAGIEYYFIDGSLGGDIPLRFGGETKFP